LKTLNQPTDNKNRTNWHWEIRPAATWKEVLNFNELWNYKSLLLRWIRRDWILQYQQTVLGPVWILLNPLLTLLTYFFVFGKLIGVPTGGIPPGLFYLSGILIWSFFSESLLAVTSTFTSNALLFSKVYFPRIIVPMATVFSGFTRLLIQGLLFLILLVYYRINGAYDPSHLNSWLFATPLLVLLVGLFSLGLGLLFSVLTGKYRDLMTFINLGVRLLMFLTPVIYPINVVPQKIQWVVLLNPLTPVMEAFRYAFFGIGIFTVSDLIYSALLIVGLFFCSLVLFNRKGDKLLDVV
jgi:lipopolysaccharide transport system permease protein